MWSSRPREWVHRSVRADRGRECGLRASFRRLAVILFLLPLGACGFQPLYGERAGGVAVHQELSGVAIDPIPDRVGQLVRNQLIDALSPGGQPTAPVYRLAVTLQQRKEDVAFQRDEQATRVNLTLEANFVLREISNDRVVARGSTRSVAAYNIVQSEFANIAAEADAVRRAARQAADSIALRLGVIMSGRGGNR